MRRGRGKPWTPERTTGPSKVREISGKKRHYDPEGDGRLEGWREAGMIDSGRQETPANTTLRARPTRVGRHIQDLDQSRRAGQEAPATRSKADTRPETRARITRGPGTFTSSPTAYGASRLHAGHQARNSVRDSSRASISLGSEGSAGSYGTGKGLRQWRQMTPQDCSDSIFCSIFHPVAEGRLREGRRATGSRGLLRASPRFWPGWDGC
jgi:hypothetical protein